MLHARWPPISASARRSHKRPSTRSPRRWFEPQTSVQSVHPTVQNAWNDWKTLLSQASGRDLDRPTAAIAGLKKAYAIASRRGCNEEPAAVLFALHTYHAIVCKLVVCRALGVSPGVEEMSRCKDGDSLLAMMRELEASGPICTASGGDGLCTSFAWHLDAWDDSMADWVRPAAELVRAI